MKGSVARILLGKFFGFMFFLFFIGVVNLLALFIKNALFLYLVGFLNANIVLLVIMSIIFLVADIFDAIQFPFSLPAPLFSAFGGVLVVTFIFNIFAFLLREEIFGSIEWAHVFVSVLVFVIVIITGYVKIFLRMGERPRKHKRKG